MADGVEVIRPDKTPFVEQVDAMFEDYRDQPEIYALIDRIRALGQPNPAASDTTVTIP